MSILLVTRTNEWCLAATEFLRTRIDGEVTVVTGERDDTLPEEVIRWSGDYLISFLSLWVLPEAVLRRATKGAVNFHPGPPEYPGIGCYNFALYDEASSYGVTCHYMEPRVDSGKIIRVSRFPLCPADDVAQVKARSMTHLLALFHEITDLIAAGKELPATAEQWTRKPYTRRELNALCEITPDMDAQEIRRRVRATYFPGYPGPYTELGGFRFALEAPRGVDHR